MLSTKMDPRLYLEENANFIIRYTNAISRRITESAISVDNADLMKTKGININEVKKVLAREKDIYNAFRYLLPKVFKKEELSVDTIINLGNYINNSNDIKGLRTNNINTISDKVTIPDFKDIELELNRLIYNYEKTWINDDPFIREAKFHIGFIKINPFSDGNHRTAILLLSYNLVKEGHCPSVIGNDLTKYYDKYILEDNIEELAAMFKIQSIKESLIIKDEFRKYLETKK